MKKLAFAALVAVAMGCAEAPPEQEKTREQTWAESRQRAEPNQTLVIDGDLQTTKQAIGWYGGTYTWGRCNLSGWPTCGGAGKIAFYRGYNQTGEGIQFWTTGGNQDVWMDLDYYTWNDGVAVNDNAKSWWMWRMSDYWTQKVWICQHVGCETYGNPDNMLAYYTYPGVPPNPNGNGNIWGVSAFWLMNHY